MENPAPFITASPKIEDEKPEKLDNIKEFVKKINEQEYKIQIGIIGNKKLIIIINNNDYDYSVIYRLQELYNITKEFRLFDNINEIFDLFIDIFTKERYDIIENNSTIMLKIQIYTINGTDKECFFELNRKEIKNDSLMKKIKFLETKISKIEEIYENKFIEQTKIINELHKTILEQNERISKLEETIISIKKNNILFNDSTIFNNNHNISFLIKRLEILNQIKSVKLLFRASRDGGYAKDFHEKCDGIKNTLTIIKTDKNYIFGGFTSQMWSVITENIKDDEAFCFSLDKMKIYNIIKGKYAIRCGDHYGPKFLSEETYIINIGNDFYNEEHNTCKVINSFYDNITEDYELCHGDYSFSINEIEVYEIIYE